MERIGGCQKRLYSEQEAKEAAFRLAGTVDKRWATYYFANPVQRGI